MMRLSTSAMGEPRAAPRLGAIVARFPSRGWLRVWLFTLAAVSGILLAWIPVHIVSLNLPPAGGRYGGTDCRTRCATWGVSPHVLWSRALPSPSPSANLVGVSGRDNTYGFHVIPESLTCLVGRRALPWLSEHATPPHFSPRLSNSSGSRDPISEQGERMAQPPEQSLGRVTKVVVATSVMLTFISFWRAAAIVLNDLGSSAFYVGGIAEQAIGKAAPWFILGVMLFSYAVRAVYVESSAMFVRGGVYRVVKEAMGGTLAKLSVSALLFDYVLTGPISGVSAGLYIVGLMNDVMHRYGLTTRSLPTGETAAFIAVLITVYFWWRNTQGIHESSDDALKIMQVT